MTVNDSHLKSIPPKLKALYVFHLEISGNSDNLEHSLNMSFISLALSVSHFEISGNQINIS